MADEKEKKDKTEDLDNPIMRGFRKAKEQLKLKEEEEEIIQERHPDITSEMRFVIKNLTPSASETDPAAIEYIKKQAPHLQVKLKDDKLIVKRPEEKAWRFIDPEGITDTREFVEDVKDIAYPLTEAGVGAATAIGTAGTGPVGLAAGAGMASLTEFIRQELGKKYGVRKDYTPEDVVQAGLLDIAVPVAGGTIKRAAKTTIPLLSKLAELTTGVESKLFKRYAEPGFKETVQELKEKPELIVKETRKIFRPIADELKSRKDEVGKSIDNLVDTASELLDEQKRNIYGVTHKTNLYSKANEKLNLINELNIPEEFKQSFREKVQSNLNKSLEKLNLRLKNIRGGVPVTKLQEVIKRFSQEAEDTIQSRFASENAKKEANEFLKFIKEYEPKTLKTDPEQLVPLKELRKEKVRISNQIADRITDTDQGPLEKKKLSFLKETVEAIEQTIEEGLKKAENIQAEPLSQFSVSVRPELKNALQKYRDLKDEFQDMTIISEVINKIAKEGPLETSRQQQLIKSMFATKVPSPPERMIVPFISKEAREKLEPIASSILIEQAPKLSPITYLAGAGGGGGLSLMLSYLASLPEYVPPMVAGAIGGATLTSLIRSPQKLSSIIRKLGDVERKTGKMPRKKAAAQAIVSGFGAEKILEQEIPPYLEEENNY